VPRVKRHARHKHAVRGAAAGAGRRVGGGEGEGGGRRRRARRRRREWCYGGSLREVEESRPAAPPPARRARAPPPIPARHSHYGPQPRKTARWRAGRRPRRGASGLEGESGERGVVAGLSLSAQPLAARPTTRRGSSAQAAARAGAAGAPNRPPLPPPPIFFSESLRVDTAAKAKRAPPLEPTKEVQCRRQSGPAPPPRPPHPVRAFVVDAFQLVSAPPTPAASSA